MPQKPTSTLPSKSRAPADYDYPVHSSASSRSRYQHPHEQLDGRQQVVVGVGGSTRTRSRSGKSSGFFGGGLGISRRIGKGPGIWAEFESSEEDSGTGGAQQVRRRTRSRIKLGEDDYDIEGLKKEKKRRRRGKGSDDDSGVEASVEITVTPRGKKVLIDGSEEEVGPKSKGVQLSKERRKKVQVVNNLDSEEDRIITPARRIAKNPEGTDRHSGKGRKRVGSNNEAVKDVLPVTKRGKVVHSWQDDENRQDQRQNDLDCGAANQNDLLYDPVLSSQERTSQRKRRRVTMGRGKQENEVEGKTQALQLDTSEDSDTPLVFTQRRRRKKTLPDTVVKIDTDGDDDEDDPPVAAVSRRRGQLSKSTRSSGHPDVDIPYSRRRLKPAGELPPAIGDDSDLVSDVELAAQTPVLKSRTRYGDSAKKLTPFQRRLKQLKAKRDGVEFISSDEGQDSPVWEQGRALYDSSSPSNYSANIDEENENAIQVTSGNTDDNTVDTDVEVPILSATKNLDSDISSFIVSDSDSDPLGAPDLGSDMDASLVPRIPIQFTSHSHASLKFHFKTAVQYILNLILNPEFPRHDEYFTFALHALDRRVDSLRDSVLKSEVWKSDFMLALKSRPHFEYDPDGGHGVQNHHCYACNRSDRNASYTVRFTGPLYDRKTLEDHSSRSSRRENRSDGDSSTPSSTSSTSSASVSEDEIGNIIPSSGHPFPVGLYCRNRAEITHSFWHWKKALRTAIEQALKHMGVFAEATDSMSPKHRWRWATSKLEALEKAGEVDLLWSMFCAQLTRAQEFMVGFFFSPLIVFFFLSFSPT